MIDKVIFLDIDGVLNNTNYAQQKHIKYFYRSEAYMDMSNVEQLRRIQSATGAKIVISSSWRRYMSLDEFMVMFAKIGVYNVIGMTNPDYKLTRGEQINEYVKKHDIRTFVVLDDGLLIRREFDVVPKRVAKRFVRVSQLYGLTKEDADDAIRVLGGSRGKHETISPQSESGEENDAEGGI